MDRRYSVSSSEPRSSAAWIVALVILFAVFVLWNVSHVRQPGSSPPLPNALLSNLCPIVASRVGNPGERTRSIFAGDSSALQALRMSVMVAIACLEHDRLVDPHEAFTVGQETEMLHKRLVDASDIEKISITTTTDCVWEFWFVKSRYVRELSLTLRATTPWIDRVSDLAMGDRALQPLKKVDLFVAIGTWDATRPTTYHSGLRLDEESTGSISSWRRALLNFSTTVKRHTADVGALLAQSGGVPWSRRRILLPILPNCSAAKFRRVLEGRSTSKIDPYMFVQGRDCRRRLVVGTAPVMREVLHKVGDSLGGSFSVVDYQQLLATSAHFLAADGSGGFCLASDGAHIDDLAQRSPLLTPCALRLMHQLWNRKAM